MPFRKCTHKITKSHRHVGRAADSTVQVQGRVDTGRGRVQALEGSTVLADTAADATVDSGQVTAVKLVEDLERQVAAEAFCHSHRGR